MNTVRFTAVQKQRRTGRQKNQEREREMTTEEVGTTNLVTAAAFQSQQVAVEIMRTYRPIQWVLVGRKWSKDRHGAAYAITRRR
jgi:hypothetical protein